MARSPNDPIGSLLDVLTPAEKAQIPWINMPPGYGPQGGISAANAPAQPPPKIFKDYQPGWPPLNPLDLRLYDPAPQPKKSEMQSYRVAELGMDPAQYQASLWLGGAGETGVKFGTDPMLKHFERRVEHTAEQRGQTKEQVLKDFINGRAPLLMIPDIIPQAIKYFRGETNAQ
jgi:hypothetical protein